MQRQKASEIVGYSRRRAKAIGCIIWPIILSFGFIGLYFWEWYALPIALLVGWLFGTIFSIFEVKRIQRMTGFDVNEQEILFRESLAAQLHPIAKSPKAYRKYIDSMPDE